MPKLTVFGLLCLILVGMMALAGHLGIAIGIVVALMVLTAFAG